MQNIAHRNEALARHVSLRIENLSKAFGKLVALDNVDLSIEGGQVHSVLGENGAGKSTVVKVISGLISADTGKMWLDGKRYKPRGPREAMAHGIGVVHQDLRLISHLSVAENLVLGWKGAQAISSMSHLRRELTGIVEKFNLAVDLSARVGELSVGEKQRVAILRALIRGSKIIILDEPTTTLTLHETEGIFQVVRALVEDGHGVVFISHKLREVLDIASKVTVLRHGKVETVVNASEVDERYLARHMLGREYEVPQRAPSVRSSAGSPALTVENISIKNDANVLVVKGISLEVAHGEIVGLVGVAGNGQRELSEAITGTRKPDGGLIKIDGEDMTGKDAREFARAGVGHIPEDRMAVGVALKESLAHNAILKIIDVPEHANRISKGPFLKRGELNRLTEKICSDGRVSGKSPWSRAGSLSGGNIQRFIAARELLLAKSLLVAVHPTRGLDVGAMEYMWSNLLSAKDRGLGICVISEDLDEVFYLATRLVIISGGTLVGEFDIEANGPPAREDLGLLMGGAVYAS